MEPGQWPGVTACPVRKQVNFGGSETVPFARATALIHPSIQFVSAVDLTLVPYSDDLDQQDLVADLVHDAVVTDADAIHGVFPPHRDAGRRSRILREQLDRRADSLLISPLQRDERLRSTLSDPDFVPGAHVRPRSALTCSQGM